LRFLRAGLSSHGYGVLEAQTGQAALDAVRQHRADMMVLDLGLPDLDGLEVIQRVRGSGDMLPIIVLSIRDDERAKVAALDFGADDYVTKPFGIVELLARIRAAQRHRLQQQGEKLGLSNGRSDGRCGPATGDGTRKGGQILPT
jgi:two-component system, OmpR family, KDP operon response regulator KdpE